MYKANKIRNESSTEILMFFILSKHNHQKTSVFQLTVFAYG